MPPIYPGNTITDVATAVNHPVISIPDVIGSFDNIPTSGDYIPLKSHKALSDLDVYNPYDIDDFRSDTTRIRHFQGIVRSQDGKHVILSGGDHIAKVAQIFTCDVLPTGTNKKTEIGIEPHIGDIFKGSLQEIFTTNDNRFWHNGGISSFGKVLILPLESDGYLPKQKFETKESLIKFLDISNPLKPKDLNIDIPRAGTNAGAASLVRLPNNYYLCAVWTDSDPNEGRHLDFYISNNTNLKSGFNSNVVRYYHSKAYPGVNPTYQYIKLILQDNGDLFMIGTENSYSWAPIPSFKGKNRARLYKIKFNLSNVINSSFSPIDFSTKLIRGTKDKVFKRGGKRYNFNGAASIYITPEKSLALYASHHRTYKDGAIISCTEFYPSFQKETITTNKEGLIELYEDKKFEGRCLRVRGYFTQTSISDYDSIKVEDDSFDNKISSIKFQLPLGATYLLYPDKNYGGTPIKLIGTGKQVSIKNIHSLRDKNKVNTYFIPKNSGNKISSSQFS